MRYVAIVLFTLLALAWRPSHANAIPSQATGAVPQTASPKPNPDASGKYHLGDGVTAPKLGLLQTRNLRPRHVAKSCKEWWS